MGNIEQACRFRTDSGYGICAKSPGITLEQEKAVGNVFNDTMNPFFPGLGSSILSCAIDGPYVLFGRNTLRTDIHGRMTIFTHTYVMTQEQYGEQMVHAPEQLLGISMHEFMDAQSGSAVMKPKQLETIELDHLYRDKLFERYNLNDPERYAMLMAGAYEALSGSKGLRLYISDSYGEPQQVIRELVYCICEGLFPSLRKKITFSSGPDTRMSFSILRGREYSSSDDMIFDVTGGSRTNLPSQNKLRARFFNDLGAADRERRAQILNSIQAWYNGWENNPKWPDFRKGSWECTSVPLLIAIYAEQNLDLDKDYRFLMFRTYTAAANKSLPLTVANERLTFLAEEMVQLNEFGTREISHVAEWFLMDCDEAFREKAGILLSKSSQEIKIALLSAALQLETAKNVEDFIRVLLKGMPINNTTLGPELTQTLINWIVSENKLQLVLDCEFEQAPLLLLLETSLKSEDQAQVKGMIQTLAIKLTVDEAILGTQTTHQLVDWIIRENALSLLNQCKITKPVLASILNAALQLQDPEPLQDMIRTLINRLPMDAGVLGSDLKQRMLLWIAGMNDRNLYLRAENLLSGCSIEELNQMAVRILRNAAADRASLGRTRMLTDVQCDIVSRLLICFLYNDLVWDECGYSLLDQNTDSFNWELKDQYISHLLWVRLKQLPDNQEKIDLMNRVIGTDPQLREILEHQLEIGSDRNVWEYYLAAKVLPNGLSFLQLKKLCTLHNKEEGTNKLQLMPEGPFEQRVADLLCAEYQAGFDPNKAADPLKPGDKPNHYAAQKANDLKIWCEEVAKNDFFLSSEAKKTLMLRMLQIFWANMTWRDIAQQSFRFDKQIVKNMLLLGDRTPELALSYAFWGACARYHKDVKSDGQNDTSLADLMVRPDFQKLVGYEQTMELVSWLLFHGMEKQHVLSLELLCLYSHKNLDRTDDPPDLDRVTKLLERYQKLINDRPGMSVPQLTIHDRQTVNAKKQNADPRKLARRMAGLRGELPELTVWLREELVKKYGRFASIKTANQRGRTSGQSPTSHLFRK